MRVLFRGASTLLAARDDLAPGALDLGLESVRRTAVVDDHVRQPAFVVERHLRLQQAARPIPGHPSRHRPLQLLLGLAPDDGEQIVALPGAGFDEERRFDHRHRTGTQRTQPRLDTGPDERMDGALEPRSGSRVGDDELGESTAIDATGGIEHRFPEEERDILGARAPGFVELVDMGVTIEDLGAEALENRPDGRLARRQTTGETDRARSRTHDPWPRRRRAARAVLAMSMAMVSGPTPPGTGVIRPAMGATLVVSTSPQSTAPRLSKAVIFLSLPG